ncbi:MAG: tRNA pseudouridine(38-40) synthase TruA, partial [Deltaproteobacteria bacterium]|nr:tRNA pseudouridine(38-40) synthase TruA [Deltaproteobacteria bacterium]
KEKNIRLILGYDGSRYHGWQRQKGVPTIQGIIEDRIQMMIKAPVSLIASGRTDAGVHAFNQVCNFITNSNIDPDSINRGLNSLLPDDIFISHAEYVPLDFHSRYSAKSKTYEYRILNQRQPDVFLRFYTWHIRGKLDHGEMRKCIALLLGKHDFSSFRSSGSRNINPVREMMRAEFHGPVGGIIYFVFEADGFLRYMVRNIMGTLVEVGRGKIGLNEFMEVFQSRDRRMAGMKAPSQGLFLRSVKY